MTTIIDKLAAALRVTLQHARESTTYSGSADSAAADALAEYDAQQPQTLADKCDEFADILAERAEMPMQTLGHMSAITMIRETLRHVRGLAKEAKASPQDYGDTATPEDYTP